MHRGHRRREPSRGCPRGRRAALRSASSACRGCDLEGSDASRIRRRAGSLPDHAGRSAARRQGGHQRPTVRRARGAILAESLSTVGLAREDVYLTNAVKHFRHEQRGKKRIHRKPSLRQLSACAPWMREEIVAVGRRFVALGATAARALTGRPVRIGDVRGSAVDTPFPMPVFVAAHPS